MPRLSLVYHFNEHGTPPQDLSVWANGAQSTGQAAEGSIIGTGLQLNGRNPLTIPASPSLALANGGPFSLALWFKAAALQSNAAIYSRRDGANGLVIGLDNGAPFVAVTNAGVTRRTSAGLPVAPGGWHHLAVTASPGFLTLYLDGKAISTLAVTLPALNTIALIGGDTAVAPPPAPAAPAPAAPATAAAPAASQSSSSTSSQGTTTAAPAGGGSASPSPATAAAPAPAPVVVAPAPAPTAMAGFDGDIDELEISNVARSAGFIKALAVGQGPDGAKFISFSVDEQTASWFSGYFAVILKSVTIDGWVVIGFLMIMAVISWTVMVDRARYVGRQTKANNRFLKAFRSLGGDLRLLDQGDAEDIATLGGRVTGPDTRMLIQSSLYRLYHITAVEISHALSGRVGSLHSGAFRTGCRLDPRCPRRGTGTRDPEAQPVDGDADDRHLRRSVPGSSRHGRRRHDHLRGDRSLGRCQCQRDRAGHCRRARRDSCRPQRRDPGTLCLQLSHLEDQRPDL